MPKRARTRNLGARDPCENRGVRWLVRRRWWLLAGAFALVFLGLVQSWTFLSWIPVEALLFFLFFALVALAAGHWAPRRPGPH